MIRVCGKGHLTGTKHCWCGSLAEGPLENRVKPVKLHPKSKGLVALRQLRAEHRVGRPGFIHPEQSRLPFTV